MCRRARQRQDGAARAHLKKRRHRRDPHLAGHKPSRDWLNFVVTSHARYKIKHLIRLEERARAIELGRRVFEKEARRYDVTSARIRSEPSSQGDGRRRGEGADDLFAQIGYGTLSAKQLIGKLVPADRLREKPPDGLVTTVVKRAFGGGEEKIKVKVRRRAGLPGRCCNPIRGEKIVGYITRGKGVSVHSRPAPT
jgi:GTP pyrophosphokinase